MSVPAAAIREWIEVNLEPDEAPSPFALADPERVHAVLSEAGFRDTSLEDVRHPVLLGGHGDIETGMGFLAGSRFGRQIREGASDAESAFRAVRRALGPYVTSDGVRMTVAVWLVTART
jgi:hypothetical protein